MKTRSLFTSGAWIAFSNFAKRIFALLSNLVLARLLVPADFGVIGIAYIFWSFFTLFTQNSTGLFILYKGTEDKRYLNTTYTVSLIIGLFVALGLAGTAPLIAKFFNEPSLTWLLMAYAFNLLLSSIYYVYVGVMNSQMQYRALANINLIASAIRLLFTTGAALMGLSYWSFAIGDTAFWIAGSIMTRYKSGHHLRLRLDPEVRSEVVSYCLGAVGSSFGFYVNANMDNFVVGKLLGSASLGFYNLAYQLTMALSTLCESVLNQLGTPVFAKLSDDRQQERALFNVVEEIAFLAAPIAILVFLLVNREVIAFVFGSEWEPVATVIPGLLVFSYFRIINGSLKSMLSAKGRPNINARVNLCIAPIAVFAFIIGAVNEGIVGVSIAVAIVLGFGWTGYWWWAGCRALGWSMNKLFVPCFKPILIAFPALAFAIGLPYLMKPIAFILIYIASVWIADRQKFAKYQALIGKIFNRMVKIGSRYLPDS